MRRLIILISLLYSVTGLFSQGLILEGSLAPTSMGTSGGDLKLGWNWGWGEAQVTGSRTGILLEDQTFKRGAFTLEGDVNKKTLASSGSLLAGFNWEGLECRGGGNYLYQTITSKTNAHQVDQAFPGGYEHFTEILQDEVRQGPQVLLKGGYLTSGFHLSLEAAWCPWLDTEITNTNYDGIPLWLVGTTIPEYVWTKNIYGYRTQGNQWNLQGSLHWEFWKDMLSGGISGRYDQVGYEGKSTLDSTTWRGLKDTLDSPVRLVPGTHGYLATFSAREQELELGLRVALLMIMQAFPSLNSAPEFSVSWVSFRSQSNTDPEDTAMVTESQWVEAYQYFRFGIHMGL